MLEPQTAAQSVIISTPLLLHFRKPPYCSIGRVMAALCDLLTLLITVQLQLSSTSSLSHHTGVRKSGSSGKHQGSASQSLEEGTSVLVLGEACGVYTPACGRGLRCFPSEGDQSPLQSLLQGKGACKSIKVSIQRTTTSGTSTKTLLKYTSVNHSLNTTK